MSGLCCIIRRTCWRRSRAQRTIEWHNRSGVSGQSGALDESISDVFGSLVKQWVRGQTVDEADWLIGAALVLDRSLGKALRSLKSPGTAYDNIFFGGKDPQPAHMRDYDHSRSDEGGVHVNSGIPNHAFYLAARELGGHAWGRRDACGLRC